MPRGQDSAVECGGSATPVDLVEDVEALAAAVAAVEDKRRALIAAGLK